MNTDTSTTVLHWWWIRHAPTAGHSNVIHGTDDAPADLSDSRALSRLANSFPPNALALTSGVARAVQTYAALRGFNPELAPAQTESDLDEQDFGLWTGRSWDEIGPLAKRFWTDPIATSPPEGESYNAMGQRVQRYIRARTNLVQRGTMITVAHAGPIRAALALALNMSFPVSIRFEIDPLSVTRIDAIVGETEIAWRVRAVNERRIDPDGGR